MIRRITLALGAALVGLALAAALLGATLWHVSPFTQDLMHRLQPPEWLGGSPAHPFGTDQLGRDYLARLLYGARISLSIGAFAVLASGTIGTVLGVLGGFFGGWIDDLVMFVITCRLSLPLVLVALALVSAVGSSLTVVALTLGLLLWDRFAVVVRAVTRQIRTQDYVAAAWSAGAGPFAVLVREVLPNLAPQLAVVATLELAQAILLEAVLSFLGLGVPPPLPSWGLMIAEGKDYMFFQPWVVTVPGVALFGLVMGVTLLGEGLRDRAA